MGIFNVYHQLFRSDTALAEKPTPPPVAEKASQFITEGNDHESKDNFAEAIRCYKSAIKLDPGLARAHLNLGNALLATGKFDAALAEYDTALKKDPHYAAAHLNIGNAYLGVEKPEQARQAYLKAIVINPEFSDAHAALGYACEELGRPEQAIEAYRSALATTPDHLQIQHNLAELLVAEGQNDEAVALFLEMYKMHPEDIRTISSLTKLLETLGRHEELIDIIKLILARQPESAEAHNNLGVALLAAGRGHEALASHYKALSLNPDFAEGHFCLGACLQKLERIEEAQLSYRKALKLDPASLKSISNLGNLLMELGRPDEAAAIFEEGVAIRPDMAEAYYNLGTALNKLGQLTKAEVNFCRALELNADFAKAYNNLGSCLNHRGLFLPAIEKYRRALELDPSLYQAQSNMGLALQKIGRLAEAITCFKKTLEINPAFGEAALNLALAYSSMGDLDKSLEGVRRAIELMPDDLQAHSSLLFLHNYRSDSSASELFAEAQYFGKLVADKAPANTSSWELPADPERCLNIGFVSGDLRTHPVGFFVEGVLAAIASQAPGGLKLYAYSSSFEDDAITERIRKNLEKWTSITGLSDASAQEIIRADKIDILIDLSGHTLYSRLSMFAWRPAPVQVTWLGYFATTGVAAIDYLIADPWTLPPSQEAYFTEKIVRLPETRLCFTPPDEVADCGQLPALKNGHVTFGCFNTLTKMNDEVVALWSRILKALPECKLILMSHQLQDSVVVGKTIGRFKEHGIDERQLQLRGFAPRAEYLATYNQIDIALDPFPYCGGTTTVEALWMGVPVLTLAGEQFLARQGVGLLMNAGLPEWVADSPDHYVTLAIKHARELSDLALLRTELRSRLLASPIFDAPRFAAHFETTLRDLWRRWCRETRI